QLKGDPQASQPGPGAVKTLHQAQTTLVPEWSGEAAGGREIGTALWGSSSCSSGARNIASARSVITVSLISAPVAGALLTHTSRQGMHSLQSQAEISPQSPGKSGLTGPSYDGLGVTADIQNERRAHARPAGAR